MDKLCKACNTVKPLEDFVNHAGKKHGKGAWCKPCGAAKTAEWRRRNQAKAKQVAQEYAQKHPNYASEQSKRWRERNPEARRRDHLRRKYGIEIEDYNTLLTSQDGKCAICGTPECDSLKKFLCVDHVDGTLLIRGLLCSQCNSAIGLLRHDPALLQAATRYLAQPPVMEGSKVPRGVHRSRLVVESQGPSPA